MFLEIRDILEQSVKTSEVLSQDHYFQYQLSIAEEWKRIPLDDCTTHTIKEVQKILLPISSGHEDSEVREALSDVVTKIDEALSLIMERRRSLSPHAQLFLLLEDRVIFEARNLCAAKILAKDYVHPPAFMFKQGWPGRGDFFGGNLSKRKRPYWKRPTRTRRGTPTAARA